MKQHGETLGACVGIVGILIVGGWLFLTYYERSDEYQVPLRVQYLEAKIRAALPLELRPGWEWFDINIGRSSLAFSIRLDREPAKALERGAARENLELFTNGFVCEWRSQNAAANDIAVMVQYYDEKDELIDIVRNDRASCRQERPKSKSFL